MEAGAWQPRILKAEDGSDREAVHETNLRFSRLLSLPRLYHPVCQMSIKRRASSGVASAMISRIRDSQARND